MLNRKLILLAALASSTFSFNAFAASATGTADAHIVTPIGITAGTHMVFSNISSPVGAGGGTVVVALDDTRTKTGGVVLLNGNTGVTSGKFSVTGEGTFTYAITIPASGAASTLSHGTDTMTVDTWKAKTATDATGATGALVGGADTITTGGTLHVADPQPAGDYTGTYTVTVEYN